MEFTLYILYSAQIDTYYVGFTGDSMEERLRKHTSNHKGFTAKAKDWKVVYSEHFLTKQEASHRERAIKSKKSRTYIVQLVQSIPT